MPHIDPRLFPTVLIVLDVCAAAVYSSHGEWKRVVYWLAAGVITASVTF